MRLFRATKDADLEWESTCNRMPTGIRGLASRMEKPNLQEANRRKERGYGIGVNGRLLIDRL
jgi:hypothetical protein